MISQINLGQMNAEVMLENAFGALAEGVAVHDPAGKLIVACPVAARILGLAQDRANVVVADDSQWQGENEDGNQRPVGELRVLASLRTGRPLRNVALRFDKPSPAGCWILAHANPIASPDNPWYGCVISTFINMTAQRSGETSLSQRQAEFLNTSQKLLLGIEAGTIGAWELDPATLEFRWDKQMFEMYGMPVQDSAPESIWRDRILPEDLPGIQQKLYRALFGKSSGPIGFWVKRADGVLRYFLMIAATAFDNARQPVRVVGLTLDQTDQIRVEQAIRLSESRQQGERKIYSEVS